MNLLNAKNLSHNFEYPLFSNINLELNSGESIAIIGESGSGKSTLLHILSSLLKPDEGEVNILEKDIYRLNVADLVQIRRDDLGLIFQSHYLFKGFSAQENLEIAALLSHKTIDKKLLNRLDVGHVISQKVTELSGGQQQRISIARILTKKPRIIFADEPTGNLDNKTSLEVMNIFSEFIKENNAAMILVTHNEEFAFSCDKVFKLHNQELEQIK